jgi:hypothetical protein
VAVTAECGMILIKDGIWCVCSLTLELFHLFIAFMVIIIYIHYFSF